MKPGATAILSIGVLGAQLAATSAFAAAPHCGEFVVHITAGDVHIQRAREGQISLGDSRMGSFELTDPDGTPVGELHFQAVAVSQKDGRFRMLGDGHYTFQNGTLHYPMSYELPDPNAQPVASGVPTVVYHVSGGTGDFEGATGTLEAAFNDNGTRTQTLSLSCSE